MKYYKNFLENNKRWLFIGLGLVLISATAANLVRQKHRSGMRWMPKEEVKAYFEANILPVLKDYRTALDAALSSEEKQNIEEIRTNLKALKESKRALGKSLREKRKNGEELTMEERANLRATMREMRQLMQKAWNITDAHSDFYDNMFEATETQREQWRADIFELVKTHRAEVSLDKKGLNDKLSGGKGHRRKPRLREEHKGPHGTQLGRGPGPLAMLGSQSEVFFLLWNPDEPFFTEEEKAELEDGFTIYPNPAYGGSNLTYKVLQAGKVNIAFIDSKGEILLTLLDEEREAGEYNLNNDVSSLQEGVYFYKITTASGTTTKRFVKK